MATLGWYARRLRSMEKRELLWRTGRAGRSLLPAIPWNRRPDIALDGARGLGACARKVPCGCRSTGSARSSTCTGYCGTARRHWLPGSSTRPTRWRSDSFCYFGYPAVSLGQPIDWHYDPIANVRWPDIAARKSTTVSRRGDVKWIWELNRLQHLPWLAQAWLFTGDNRYSSAAFEQLDSWIAQNPPGHGIAWRGAFEAGVRAISIAVALQGLREAPELTVERYRRIVRVLADSASRCWSDRSRFSSANNHIVGEMAGLAVVAITLPELKMARNGSSARSRRCPLKPTDRFCRTALAPNRQWPTRCLLPSSYTLSGLCWPSGTGGSRSRSRTQSLGAPRSWPPLWVKMIRIRDTVTATKDSR